ncbi:MAG: glycosyltransferase family 4 protein [Bacteroidota bacterium]
MRIALLAPVALPVPPTGYGGTEVVVHLLAEGLTKRGHPVTLFATGDSRTSAELSFLFPRGLLGEGIEKKNELFHLEAAHVSRALARAGEFDLVHDHTKCLGTILSSFVDTPCLTTIHNDFTLERLECYLAHPEHPFVSISHAQARACPTLRYAGTVHNGIELGEVPFMAQKEDYLLFLGRLADCKGAHTAIELARKTERRLVLAGKIDDPAYFRRLEPSIDGQRIRYIGEVAGRQKWELLSQAQGLLFPIEWNEPFGLVMIEAMACGTPVLALDRGAVPEVVAHGRSGLVLPDATALLEGLRSLPQIDPHACRDWVEERFSADAMVERYLEVYSRFR